MAVSTSAVTITSNASSRHWLSRAPLAVTIRPAAAQAAWAPATARAAPASAPRSAATAARCRATIAAPTIAPSAPHRTSTSPAASTHTEAAPRSLRTARRQVTPCSAVGRGRGPAVGPGRAGSAPARPVGLPVVTGPSLPPTAPVR